MCGIAGFFCNSNRVDSPVLSSALRVMAREMESRGTDSWGLMDNQTVVHGMGRISKGLHLPKYLSRAVAVHTRYATTGKVKQSNAHPFVLHPDSGAAPIFGMHNGIISNHHTLNAQYNRSCRVDSQHIFSHIANSIPFDDLEGYGTIVYSQNGEWYIGTFNGGELAVYQTSAGILFASTREAIYKALDAAHLWKSAQRIELKDNTIYQISAEGLRVAYTVNVQHTPYKWGAALPDYAGYSAFKWTEGGCLNCLNPLEPDADYCGWCGCPVDSDDPTFDVMPNDCELPCAECGTLIRGGDEFSDGGNGEVYCESCASDYPYEPDPRYTHGPETGTVIQ